MQLKQDLRQTEKLYDQDAYLWEFDATVISCAPMGKQYAVELDQTAFFPEGGGQTGDDGTLNDVAVKNTVLQGGRILHLCDAPLAVGQTVHGRLDGNLRFTKMQNHSAEHVVSGLVHSMFGGNNIGFHLGEGEVTMDYDIFLDDAQIDALEIAVNRAVWDNRAITVFYPTPEQAATLSYRSKLDITENLRLVEVAGVDLCACCAPHVKTTGEIGCVKIVGSMRNKGGVRLFMLAGEWALRDYQKISAAVAHIAAATSVKRENAASGFDRLQAELNAANAEGGKLRRLIVEMTANGVSPDEKTVCLFPPFSDALSTRNLMNRCLDAGVEICACFFGERDGRFQYIVGSKTTDMVPFSKELNAALNGRGGGKPDMAQGSVFAPRSAIEEFFAQRR